MSGINRITIDKNIMHGKPTVRGMRWTVEIILDMLSSGMAVNEIIEDHPELEREDILACLTYAKLQFSGHSIENVA